MATTNINWSDLVGLSTVKDGGYIGDLLTLARAHVDEAVTDNELTQEQAGTIYTSMIPSAFQHGLNFGLQKQLSEAQVDKLIFDKKKGLLDIQLGLIVDLYKNKQLDSLTEIIGNQSEVEHLYNTILTDFNDIPTTIVPGE